ncbi:methionine biosynthesis protein MetW [Deefgea piscis]|uniref:Methionine biosynthesis protein MetW n=1 Tax=Deefgea piscis TaxID=2739061 RepID=A0A6M8SP77_9NEIS|nr:methionine biosynthesis protein MetW [Deefgea piscis]QKJ66501.1 methionine biosynthesis protein MetW [Deefgea piscis]
MAELINLRPDLKHIAQLIKPASRVLDLGCADGELLAWLQANKQVRGIGVDVDVNSIVHCVEKNLNVIQADMESGLQHFEDGSFDFVVLSLTIQSMHNVELILQEMLRVGRCGIVTFPNFGYWENRWQILKGQMPVSETIPYEWYNTPNIHFCTVNDFSQLLAKLGMQVDGQVVLHQGEPVNFLPNLLGSLALVQFSQTKRQQTLG